MGNYNQFKLEAVFPNDRSNYDTLEKFYKKVMFNINSIGYRAPDADFNETIELLYNISDEEYHLIRALKIEYRIFRKAIPYFNKALTTSTPVENVNCIMGAYKEFNSIISNFISDVFRRYKKYEMREVGDQIKGNVKAAVICRSKVYNATNPYRVNELTEEYIDELISYKNVKYEISRAIDKRLNEKVRLYEEGIYQNNMERIVDQQEKYRKAHRGHRS